MQLRPSLEVLVPDIDLACMEIDDGIAQHIEAYALDDLGIETPESSEWVDAAVRANPGRWTARLCRQIHDLPETEESIVHCGLCKEYANPRKRARARAQSLTKVLPGFEEIGGAYQLHPRCGRRGLTWLRKLAYRRCDTGRWQKRREKIPDVRQSRGWDWASRIYPA
jgi:hypothetical protein